MSRTTHFLKIVLPLLALALGVLAFLMLSAQKKAPRQQVRENRGVLVETITVARSDFQVEVSVSGTVQPRLRTALAPQIAGRVEKVSPRMVEGGFFRKGEPLFTLEQVDYRLAVQQAESSLAEAERNLLTVQSQAKVARQEWETLGLGNGEEPNPLVLFKPQLAEAQARLASATAALQQARINLQRTEIRSPFNGRVVNESLDVGQFLRSGDAVITLVGSDRAEVVVPVPLAELTWLQVPGFIRNGPGSTAKVRLPGVSYEWSGVIDRSLAEVDARGRMPRLAVSVDNPFNLEGTSGRPDLAIGLFVEVTLLGPKLENAISIPRAALRENNTVWLMKGDGTLQIQPVDVQRIQREQVLLTAGLEGGEQLVMTPLAGAANGMKLRTLQGDSQ